MKGLALLSVFAFFYLLIIILLTVVVGEPRGVQENIGQPQPSDAGAAAHSDPNKKNEINRTKNATAVPTLQEVIFGHVATNPSQAGHPQASSSNKSIPVLPTLQQTVRDVNSANQPNDTNPLADLFEISDPTTRTALGAIYGAYRGDDQCSRKAFCMMGNYMKNMPGRDLVFLMMGNYIPAEYSLYYEIFKAAVIYGQNCTVYVCLPEPQKDQDAALSARPKQKQQFSNNNNDQSLNANSLPR